MKSNILAEVTARRYEEVLSQTSSANSTATGGTDRFKNKETAKIDWSAYID